jgi:hypothetical protein
MLWLTSKSLYYHLLCGDLIVKIGLNLDDCSKLIRVEKDMTLCELHNGDVGIFCGWPNFKKKILCLCVSHFNLLHVLIQALFLFRV